MLKFRRFLPRLVIENVETVQRAATRRRHGLYLTRSLCGQAEDLSVMHVAVKLVQGCDRLQAGKPLAAEYEESTQCHEEHCSETGDACRRSQARVTSHPFRGAFAHRSVRSVAQGKILQVSL